MKYLLLLMVPLMAASCANRIPPQVPLQGGASENNRTYQVDYLFEHDGCKVYRFTDHGYYVYFTSCRGEAIVKMDSTEIRNRIWR